MSLGRLVDLMLIAVGMTGLLVVQMGAAPMLDEMRNEFNEDPATGNIDQQQLNNDMFEGTTKWTMTVAFIGLFVIAGFREYRRQRTTTTVRRRVR